MTKNFIIMGANDGIGGQLAARLSQSGYSVFATARDRQNIIQLEDQKNIRTAALDVLKKQDVENVIAQADDGDGIQGLAYCIGSINLKSFQAATYEDFITSYELNVMGAVQALRAAEAGLKKAQGSVVLFSSIAVQQGFSNHTVISTAKGAIEGLTRALAAEWAPHIRVNCIAPSLTDTPLAKALTSSEAMASSIAKMHPIPRLGTPEDAASLAQFLLTDASSWITGQVIHLDGGRSSLRVKG